MLRRVDRGEIQLITPVSEVIPEFGVKGKQHVTVAQLLSHTGGVPPELPFVAIDRFGDTEAVALASKAEGGCEHSKQALIARTLDAEGGGSSAADD